jgi:hypothetical protein
VSTPMSIGRRQKKVGSVGSGSGFGLGRGRWDGSWTRPRYYDTCTVLCVVCWYSNWPFTSGKSGMKSLKSQAPTLSRQPRNKKPKCDTNMVWYIGTSVCNRMYKNDACGITARNTCYVCIFRRYFIRWGYLNRSKMMRVYILKASSAGATRKILKTTVLYLSSQNLSVCRFHLISLWLMLRYC